MNTNKQFWTLFKFQFVGNPSVYATPVILALPFMTLWMMGGHYHSLDLLLMPNFTFIYAMLIFMILVPEVIQRSAYAYNTGIELVLTRAVDRPLIYRSKTFLLFLLLLIFPFLMILHSTLQPELKITEYSKATQHYYLESLPGSTISTEGKGETPVLTIPRGNILLSEYQLWTSLALLVLIQLAITCLYPLKHRGSLLWAIYIGFMFVPALSILSPLMAKGEHGTPNIECFLFFASHPVLFWIVAAPVFVLTQVWCERRFVNFEF